MPTDAQILEAAHAAAKAAEHLANAWTAAETGNGGEALKLADEAQAELRKALRRLPKGREALGARAVTALPVSTGESPRHRTERELLKVAIQHPGLMSPHFRTLTPDEFTHQGYARLRAAITAERSEDAEDAPTWVSACDEAADGDTRALYAELAAEEIRRRPGVDRQFADEQLVTVRGRALETAVKEVQDGLTSDPSEEAQRNLWSMQQYRMALREQGAAALGEHPEALVCLHDQLGSPA
ncbi:hypothetical protein ACOKM3_14305 [Streptomyces sp. BH106]|uniref:hypothetical protein n=1 Tax=Streptomyces sp. BH106 TaxID=3410409 RepID=UPI003CF9D9D0